MGRAHQQQSSGIVSQRVELDGDLAPGDGRVVWYRLRADYIAHAFDFSHGVLDETQLSLCGQRIGDKWFASPLRPRCEDCERLALALVDSSSVNCTTDQPLTGMRQTILEAHARRGGELFFVPGEIVTLGLVDDGLLEIVPRPPRGQKTRLTAFGLQRLGRVPPKRIARTGSDT